MSGIYIPGMEMPRDENDSIHILRDGTAVVYRAGSIDFYKAVPVPEHGRLIDADALCEGRVSNDNVVICAKTAPTVIPADKEGEE